jgi:hypothetical protein
MFFRKRNVHTIRRSEIYCSATILRRDIGLDVGEYIRWVASLEVIYVLCRSVPVRTTVQVRRKRKEIALLNWETQQMHPINKLDIFFTYTANIFWILLLLNNKYYNGCKYSKYIGHSEIGPLWSTRLQFV